MKKSGKIFSLVAGFMVIGYIIGELSKYNFTNTFEEKSKVNLDQYLNRLTEFDLNDEKEATNLFLDLIQSGFYPENAFNLVKKECLEAGEIL